MNGKVLTLVVAITAVAGCSLNRTDLGRDTFLARIGGGGQIIEPKRCNLRVAILSRPLREEAINGALWSVVDEQSIAPELRRALEVNGLRMGLITGELPHEVDSILNAKAPHKVEPSQFEFPDGDHAMIDMVDTTPEVSLLLNREGRAFGKPYQDASGWFRVTANHDGATGVALRFVPEIHHGPIQRAFTALPNAGSYSPQQFMQKDGQQEESLRELATTLTLQPGQIAVVGCLPEASRSLGSFMFTQPEANSDRLLQRVLLVWASREGVNQPVSSSLPSLVPVDPPKS
ncbi:hypothetical protein V5E97_03255 [Singulisphaera sp. Ch08]|uniref:Uncharacterized protein n=1 Tax=Singulisphaera sp. Ch08 TaxID=3120278 RepID=A0AAU7CIG2_9BACT